MTGLWTCESERTYLGDGSIKAFPVDDLLEIVQQRGVGLWHRAGERVERRGKEREEERRKRDGGGEEKEGRRE